MIYIGLCSHFETLPQYICYFFIGTYDKNGSESGGTIGWAVTYNNLEKGNSYSTCTWSGQRQLDNNNPVILTTWLLTKQTEATKNWESTYVNQDFFHRWLPRDEKIRATLTAQNFKEYTCTKSD